MISFNCPSCQRRLKAPISRAGARLSCPSCSAEVVVPSTEATQSESSNSIKVPEDNVLDWLSEGNDKPMVSEETLCESNVFREVENVPTDAFQESPPSIAPQTKQCPFCAETIQFAAQKCRYCNEFLDGRESHIRSNLVPQSVAHQRASASTTKATSSATTGRIRAAFVIFAISVLLFICSGILNPPTLTNGSNSGRKPTYRDAMQVLVDEVDERVKSNIFGSVKCEGDHLFVVVESDYFVKLDERTKRLALTSVRDQWVNKCYGKRVTFTKWNGEVVAEL